MTETAPPPEQPTPQAPGSPPGWNTENLKDYRRLRRSRDDRKIAGVAGGLGRHLDIDPTVVRVLFVALALFGGAGLLLYAVLWLVVPEEGTEESVIRTSDSTRNALLIGAAVVAALVVVGDGWSRSWFPWPLAVIAVILFAVFVSRDKGPSGQAPPPPAYGPQSPPPAYGPVPPATDYGPVPPPPAYGPVPPAPAYAAVPPSPGYVPPPPPPPRPRRTGPLLFGVTLALVAVALGVLGLVDASGAAVDDAAYPALALGVVGAMLVLGAFFGRAGGLVLLGLVAVFALAVAALGEPSYSGDRDLTVRPARAADLGAAYDVPAGRIVLDLTDVQDTAELDGRTVELDANVGEILLVVPRDLDVTYDAEIAYGGAIEVPGATRDGWDSRLRGELDGEDANAHLTVEMDLQFGHIEVERR